MSSSIENCEVPGCINRPYITWKGRAVCKKHWIVHCNPTIKWRLDNVFSNQTELQKLSSTKKVL